MDVEYELATDDRFGGLLLDRKQLAKPNEYYHKIHPTEATHVDAKLTEEKTKAEAKAKADAAAKAKAAADAVAKAAAATTARTTESPKATADPSTVSAAADSAQDDKPLVTTKAAEPSLVPAKAEPKKDGGN